MHDRVCDRIADPLVHLTCGAAQSTEASVCRILRFVLAPVDDEVDEAQPPCSAGIGAALLFVLVIVERERDLADDLAERAPTATKPTRSTTPT